MLEFDFELVKTNVNHINNSVLEKSTNKTNSAILNTVKYLLNCVDYTDELLSSYDRDELKVMYALYKQVAHSCCHFYESANQYLDPKLIAGKLKTDIEKATQEIDYINRSYDEMCEKEEILLSREALLTERQKLYDALMQKIEALQNIENTVSKEVIANLQGEISMLEDAIRLQTTKTNEQRQSIKNLESALEEISNAYIDENENKSMIETNIVTIIDKRTDDMWHIYKDREEGLDHIKRKIEQYKEYYEMLSSSCAEIEHEYQLFDLHFGENSRMAALLKSNGLSSIEDFIKIAKDHCVAKKEELHKFDDIFYAIMKEQEAIQEDISIRQNK